MQEKRKSIPSPLGEHERRADLRIIRTKVSKKEIYLWAACLCFMITILTSFIIAGLLVN